MTHKGYSIVPIEIPFLAEGQVTHALSILATVATAIPDTSGMSPANRILVALGPQTNATDYILAQKLRRVLMQHLAWLWREHPRHDNRDTHADCGMPSLTLPAGYVVPSRRYGHGSGCRFGDGSRRFDSYGRMNKRGYPHPVWFRCGGRCR